MATPQAKDAAVETPRNRIKSQIAAWNRAWDATEREIEQDRAARVGQIQAREQGLRTEEVRVQDALQRLRSEADAAFRRREASIADSLGAAHSRLTALLTTRETTTVTPRELAPILRDVVVNVIPTLRKQSPSSSKRVRELEETLEALNEEFQTLYEAWTRQEPYSGARPIRPVQIQIPPPAVARDAAVVEKKTRRVIERRRAPNNNPAHVRARAAVDDDDAELQEYADAYVRAVAENAFEDADENNNNDDDAELQEYADAYVRAVDENAFEDADKNNNNDDDAELQEYADAYVRAVDENAFEDADEASDDADKSSDDADKSSDDADKSLDKSSMSGYKADDDEQERAGGAVASTRSNMGHYLRLNADGPPLRNDLLTAWRRTLAEMYIKPPQKRAWAVRIVSYNVHNGFFNPEDDKSNARAMIDEIGTLEPDILALQEVSWRTGGITREQLTAALESQASLLFAGACRASGLYGGWYGNQLWVRRFLLSMPSKKESGCNLHTGMPLPPEEGRCFVLRCFAVPGTDADGRARRLCVANVQLDVSSEATRVAEVRAALRCIEAATTQDDYVVIVGDFNAVKRSDYTPAHWEWLDRVGRARNSPQDTTTLELFRRAGFIDAATKPMPLSVWSGKRVDFVLLGGALRPEMVQRHFVHPTDASDHLPIVLDLQLPRNAAPVVSRSRTRSARPTTTERAAAEAELGARREFRDDVAARLVMLGVRFNGTLRTLIDEQRRMAKVETDANFEQRKRALEASTGVVVHQKAVRGLREMQALRSLLVAELRRRAQHTLEELERKLDEAQRQVADDQRRIQLARTSAVKQQINLDSEARIRGFPTPGTTSFSEQLAGMYPELRMSAPPPAGTAANQCSRFMGSGAPAQPYQRVIRQLLRPESPYRGFLAYHGVGSGKTRLAWDTIEQWFLDRLATGKTPGTVLVLVPTDRLLGAWRADGIKWLRRFTIVPCPAGETKNTVILQVRPKSGDVEMRCGPGEVGNPRWGHVVLHRMTVFLPPQAIRVMEMTATDRGLAPNSQYALPASDYTTHPAYLTLSAATRTELQTQFAEQVRAVREAADHFVLQADGLVVVDEAHNLVNPAAAARTSADANKVLGFANQIEQAPGAKLLYMTATPQQDDTRLTDLIKLLNMLLPKGHERLFEGTWRRTLTSDSLPRTREAYLTADDAETRYLESQTFDLKRREWLPGRKEQFQRTYAGLVSYVTLENDPTLYPRISTHCDGVGTCTWRWENQQSTMRPVSEAELQTLGLPTSRHGRQILVPMTREQYKAMRAAMDEDLREFRIKRRPDVPANAPPNYADLNFGGRINKASMVQAFGLRTYHGEAPPKLRASLWVLRSFSKEKHFLFTVGQNLNLAKSIKGFFEAQGFQVIDIPELARWVNGAERRNGGPFVQRTDPTTGNTVSGSMQMAAAWYAANTKRPRILMFVQSATVLNTIDDRDINKVRELMPELFNNRSNNQGEFIQAFVGDKDTREGITLLHVLHVHLLDTVINRTMLTQAEARVLRFCSHRDFSSDRWVVTLWRYISIPPDSATARRLPPPRRRRFGGAVGGDRIRRPPAQRHDYDLFGQTLPRARQAPIPLPAAQDRFGRDRRDYEIRPRPRQGPVPLPAARNRPVIRRDYDLFGQTLPRARQGPVPLPAAQDRFGRDRRDYEIRPRPRQGPVPLPAARNRPLIRRDYDLFGQTLPRARQGHVPLPAARDRFPRRYDATGRINDDLQNAPIRGRIVDVERAQPQRIQRPRAEPSKEATNEQFQWAYLVRQRPLGELMLQALKEIAVDCRQFRAYNADVSACYGQTPTTFVPQTTGAIGPDYRHADRWCYARNHLLLQSASSDTLYEFDADKELMRGWSAATFDQKCQTAQAESGELPLAATYRDLIVFDALAAWQPGYRPQTNKDLGLSFDASVLLEVLKRLTANTQSISENEQLWQLAQSVQPGHRIGLGRFLRDRILRQQRTDPAVLEEARKTADQVKRIMQRKHQVVVAFEALQKFINTPPPTAAEIMREAAKIEVAESKSTSPPLTGGSSLSSVEDAIKSVRACQILPMPF